MNKPLHTWLIFLGCLALIGGAMTWVTWHTLRLENQREVAARSAETQERTRIALWRLDFNASALLIRENSRAPQDFVPFHTPSAYSTRSKDAVEKGSLLLPSPLLATLPDHVLLHFQMDEKGDLVSPQVPRGDERALALQEAASEADIALAEQRLNQLHALLARPTAAFKKAMPEVNARASRPTVLSTSTASQQTNRERLAFISAQPLLAPDNESAASLTMRGYLGSGAVQLRQDVPGLATAAAPPPPAPLPNTTVAPAAAMPAAGKDQPRSGTWAPADTAIAQQVGVTQSDNFARNKAVQSKINTYNGGMAVKSGALVLDETKQMADKMAGAKGQPQPPAALAKAKMAEEATPRPASSAAVPAAPAAAATVTASSSASAKDSLAKAATGQPAKPAELMPSDPFAATASPMQGAASPTGWKPVPLSGMASTSTPPLQGYWIDDALLLSRQAMVDGRKVIQGVWLDWPKLQTALLDETRDLFPEAKLEPGVMGDPSARPSDDPLRMAALPLHFAPGVLALPPLPYWSALRVSLAVALVCMGLAALAVAWVLHGAVSLSERRAAFVSAVTHELRTPLTTFRLYSEMLADDMVQDPEQRRSYLGTLTGEATRLSHLVENVLAYARLERGSARARVESVSIGEVLDRIVPRLRQRTEQAAMELRMDVGAAERATRLHVDVAALEQILFNLVDNACKYAGPRASEPIIHIEADTSGKFAMLRVRDHGQGIAKQERRRIFHPFHKSADDAAHSAPGVGLGLALCRRLVGALGGEIALDTAVEKGACFVVKLPVG